MLRIVCETIAASLWITNSKPSALISFTVSSFLIFYFLFLLQCSNAGSHVAPNLCVHLFIGVTQPALVGLRSGFVHAKGQEKIY